jgi:hypothetical protein
MQPSESLLLIQSNSPETVERFRRLGYSVELLRFDRLCSGCEENHPIDGRPCLKCWPVWSCPKDGKVNDFGKDCTFIDGDGKTCGFEFVLSRSTLRKIAHGPSLVRCPKCGRKLRNQARDKKRTMGLKDDD